MRSSAVMPCCCVSAVNDDARGRAVAALSLPLVLLVLSSVVGVAEEDAATRVLTSTASASESDRRRPNRPPAVGVGAIARLHVPSGV